ncbi:MAG: pyridoxal phosphate-dependent aminotransferase [Jiangellaceae bacterium]
MNRTSRRLAKIPESATVELTDRLAAATAAGRRITNLAGGDPDFATPAHIVHAATRALAAGRTHYGPSRGIPSLREAIAEELRDTGVHRDPLTDVLVTASAKFALSLALQAVLDPGDEVLVLTPAWVSYVPLVRLHGGVAVPVDLNPARDYEITAADLQHACGSRTKAILVNTPTNPTGRVLAEAEIAAVISVATAADLTVISDEVYRHIVFRGRHFSPSEIAPDRTVVVDGTSKGYAMTGWRLGWLTGPADIVAVALTAHQHMVSCAPTFIQDAGVAALTGPTEPVAEMVATYAARRRQLIDALAGAPGVSLMPPQGTFYAYLDVSGTGLTGTEFSDWLVEDAGVAVMPGQAFGDPMDSHIRMSLALPTAALEAALAALRRSLDFRAHRDAGGSAGALLPHCLSAPFNPPCP